MEKLERSPVCQRLPLRSFLVLPFQRITRLKLLVQVCVCVCAFVCVWVYSRFEQSFNNFSVQNIVKRTAPGTAEATQAIKAFKLLEKVAAASFPLYISALMTG